MATMTRLPIEEAIAGFAGSWKVRGVRGSSEEAARRAFELQRPELRNRDEKAVLVALAMSQGEGEPVTIEMLRRRTLRTPPEIRQIMVRLAVREIIRFSGGIVINLPARKRRP